MQKLVVRGYALSIDGFSSAQGQSLENPFGVKGLALMDWFFQTRTCRQMFGPVRGPWVDGEWKVGQPFTSSLMASRRHCDKPLPLHRGRTYAWAEARRWFANISGRGWSMNCISSSPTNDWVLVSACLKERTTSHVTTNAWSRSHPRP